MLASHAKSLRHCLINIGGSILSEVTGWCFSKAFNGPQQALIAFLNQVE